MSFLNLENMSTMDNLLENDNKKLPANGEIVDAKVTTKTQKGVLVSIDFKSEGFIPKIEFGEKWEALKVGDEIQVIIEQLENLKGALAVSYEKVIYENAWNNLLLDISEGNKIIGKVTQRIKSGFIVDVKGIETFLPGSHASLEHIKNYDNLVGEEFEIKILKVSEEKRNIIVSRKKVLEEQREKDRILLFDKLEVGDVVKGLVKNITSFGAFVEVDGVDGLIHIGDLSWKKIHHPSEIVSIGEEVEVMILVIDKEKLRLGLGLKQKTKDPWEDLDDKYKVEDVLEVEIINILPYGMFARVDDSLEGFIHSSEFSWTISSKRLEKVFVYW